MTLRNIFNNLTLRCDKWSEYFNVYEMHLGKFVNNSPVVVEVGVAGGGSLEMWDKYFGKTATLYGIDNIPQIDQVNGATLILGDQSSPIFWDNFLKTINGIDVFVDDGSHINKDQILTFTKVWPHMRDGGVYICEDTHTSYWQQYGGQLKNPSTFMEFSKQLTDVLNISYINDAKLSAEFFNLVKDIGSISFYDSQVVFTKGKQKNVRVTVNA